jgi:hypothetical protein
LVRLLVTELRAIGSRQRDAKSGSGEMKIFFVLGTILALSMTSCAPLVIGTAAGLFVARHENHRNWCIQYYGNPHCFKHGHPTAYTYHMPEGFH